MNFTTIAEEMLSLPFEDKIELKILLDKYIIEERRKEIKDNYEISLQNAKAGELDFSDDVDKLLNKITD
jgi:hypothetical protein